ncbi:MAG: gamma-glutamyltransferase [Chloroflexi bacterium]|nr:gamma-glutamyltransferase [Chloroflexota bacterium]
MLEARFPGEVAEALSARGHEVLMCDPVDPVMGTVQLIEVHDGYYVAATDPRGDGVALAA